MKLREQDVLQGFILDGYNSNNTCFARHATDIRHRIFIAGTYSEGCKGKQEEKTTLKYKN